MDHDDRFAIEDLLQRYTTAIDDKDWDLLDTVFAPDAVLDYTTSGGPKGSYPATPIRKMSLFGCFAEYLVKVEQKYGSAVPWYSVWLA